MISAKPSGRNVVKSIRSVSLVGTSSLPPLLKSLAANLIRPPFSGGWLVPRVLSSALGSSYVSDGFSKVNARAVGVLVAFCSESFS